MGIFSSIFGGNAQQNAAKDQINLAKSQIAESRAASTDAMGYLQPYSAAGSLGLREYLNSIGLGDSQEAINRFQASPEYQLNYQRALDEGRQGVTNVAQGTGTYNSGRTLKALQDRAQQTSRGFFSDYLKGIAGIADTGYNAANAKAGIRQTGASAINQGYQAQALGSQNLADARTAQYAGFDNLLSGGLKLAGSIPGSPLFGLRF